MCQQKPEMFMQMIQTEPRFMDVFQELTGIDLMDVQLEKMKIADQRIEELAKIKAEEERKLKEAEDEEERKRKEAEAVPEEKKEAEALKTKGNEFYKQKNLV